MFTVPSNSSPGSATLSRDVPCAVYADAFSVVSVVLSAMSRSLCLLAHDHDAARLSGDRTADVDQIALGVDFLDTEVRLRVARVAVVSRHFLALDDARGVGAGSDRARTTVLRVAVRVRTTADAVALHDALKAATLRRAGDLDRVADLEDVDLHDVADAVRRNLDLGVARLVEPHAAQHARRRIKTSLLGMANGRERGAMSLGILLLALRGITTQPRRAESELDRRVAVLGFVRHGEDRIRFGLDDRDRNLLALLVEDLGHAQLLTDDTNHEILMLSHCR